MALRGGEKSSKEERLRTVIRSSLAKFQYKTALFWADKLVTLSQEDVRDVCMLALCQYMCKEYHRAAHTLLSRGLHTQYLLCKYMTARIMMDTGDQQGALEVLTSEGPELAPAGTSETGRGSPSADQLPIPESDPKILEYFGIDNLQSAIFLLQGRLHELLENRFDAIAFYSAALKEDVYCFEALDLLIEHHMLRADEVMSYPTQALVVGQQIEWLKISAYFPLENRTFQCNGATFASEHDLSGISVSHIPFEIR